MAKANLSLPNGTIVNIEGTPEEIRQLLSFYGGAKESAQGDIQPKKTTRSKKSPTKASAHFSSTEKREQSLSQIITQIKSCPEAEQIERNVLDQTSIVNRTLLPLFIVHEFMDNEIGLTSGDVTKITNDLGVPVAMPHASTALSNTGKSYVIGDRVRKKGQPVKYKLSRRGVQYMRSVIRGAGNENQK